MAKKTNNNRSKEDRKEQGKEYHPQGVKVDLTTLQQLRHLATHFSSSTRKASSPLSGLHRSQQQNRGMEFEEVRLYQAGDDVRSIDWRVTARTQTPHTKCFQEEREKPVITLVDQRRSLFFGSQHCFKSVYACQLAALINWSTLAKNDRCGGIVMSTTGIRDCRPARSHRTVNRWLQMLAESSETLCEQNSPQTVIDKKAQTETEEPRFIDGLYHIKNSLHRGADIAVISDFYDVTPECEALLFNLSKHHRLSFFWIIDPLEITLPNRTSASRVTLSNGRQETEITLSKSLQQKHQQFFRAKKNTLDELCLRLGIQLQLIHTNKDLLHCVQAVPLSSNEYPSEDIAFAGNPNGVRYV